ncbi:MAG: fluoride efflux transporter CrcB [Thermodesulfobacteriota bacterium]|nr:fluoride efflux transporter CrcB [Deltaproteobacteria bacterium TMED58]RZP16280.1 MAG: fluoride efflux transporter CrcB [Candidatus Dadabacteria bacterium]|tara:strand:+ start:498 stop:869 length:372 start_codon:yes stop_codon:yes gene_type:complete
MINLILVVGLGGAIGAIARYLTGIWMLTILPNKPFISTLIVNFIGSALIGFFYLISSVLDIKDSIRLLFVVGFLGSLTTFSTFSYEFVTMINQKNYLLAMTYILLNLSLSGMVVYIILKFARN